MKLVFKYPSVERPGALGSIKAPAIPIVLVGKDSAKQFHTIALIDTGADFSALPSHVAEILGLDLSGEKETVSGVGGKVEAIRSEATLVIKGRREKATMRLELRVVLADVEDEFPVLLGRKDFLERFEVTINEKEGKIWLQEI